MLSVRARHRLGDFRLDVAFDGPADGITVLFGPSGAGKSATLAVIAGALRPAAGRVVLDGRILTDTDAHIHVRPEKRRIGVVHQEARLFPHMPVGRNLLYGWTRTTGARRIEVDAVVEVLAIGHLLDRRPSDLSGGERQRVALGRAMLSQPDMLLLDEPVSALDGARRAEVLGFIAELRGAFGLPMVYVTHSEAEATRLGDTVVRLDAGRVAGIGPPGAMFADARLEGSVEAHDAGGTMVRFADAAYRLPRIDAAPGASVEVRW